MDAITVITLIGRIIAGLASLVAEYALYRQRKQEADYPASAAAPGAR